MVVPFTKEICNVFIIWPGGLENSVSISIATVLKSLGTHIEVSEYPGYIESK